MSNVFYETNNVQINESPKSYQNAKTLQYFLKKKHFCRPKIHEFSQANRIQDGINRGKGIETIIME